MTTANVSDVMCLICKNSIDVSSCINIFYTSLPKSGELLASFVIATIRPTVTDLASSYLCSECYNLFQMLEQAQSTVTSIQNEILKIYNKNDEIIVNRRINGDDKIGIDDICQVPIDDYEGLNNETAELISTNLNEKDKLTKNPEIPNNEIHELPNENVVELEKNDEIELINKSMESSPEVSSKYSCSTCDKKFRTSAELKTHIKSHSSLRPYMCEKCGQAYKHKHALKIHIGMHNGINPFKCSYCDKCFTQKGALMRHLPMHTGETPYQCELCGKRFVHHTSYNMHTLSHTGKKSHQCHICSLSLLSKSHLKRHLKVHSGEKPFSCDLCGKKFAERYNLFAHQKIHDPDEVLSINSKNIEHKCNHCAECFYDKETFDNHMKRHLITVDQINDSHPSQANWDRLNIDRQMLQQGKYREFDLIARNDFQEPYNVETI